MIALIRYTSASMLHSQRYLAPVLLFMAALGVLSSNDSGPLAPVYGLCAGTLFVCATWFTIALISIEDPAHRAITVVSARHSGKVLLASVSVAVISCLGGLLCSRLVIRRRGYALIIALALVMALLFVRGLPPVNVLLRMMANATTSADLVAPAGGLLAIAAVILVASSIATQFITTRKE